MFPTQHPIPTPALLLSFPPVKRWVILPVGVAQANQTLFLRSFLAKLEATTVSRKSVRSRLVGDSHGCAALGALVEFLKVLS